MVQNWRRVAVILATKGQKVVFDYTDSLGRLKTKSVYGASGTLTYVVNYSYDQTAVPGFTVYPGQLGSVTDSELSFLSGERRWVRSWCGAATKNGVELNSAIWTSLFAFWAGA